MKKKIIEFKDFSFQYRVQAEPTVKNINLSIYEGEKVLIVGPSGSGKSTLAHCINGLVPFFYDGIVTGQLNINGNDATKMNIFELSKIVGTVLQDPDSQFIGLTVREDIAFKLENYCISQDEMIDRVDKSAELVDIKKELYSSPYKLSGGQKQRVTLAGVTVDDVKILLFDEPLASLDPATGESAIELIDKMQKQNNKTAIIIEHRLEDVLHCDVDRVIVMDKGEIIADTTIDEIIRKDILRKVGIREPLYLTALRYADCEINDTLKLKNIETLELGEYKEKLKDWYENIEVYESDENQNPILELDNINFSYNNEKQILKNVFERDGVELVKIRYQQKHPSCRLIDLPSLKRARVPNISPTGETIFTHFTIFTNFDISHNIVAASISNLERLGLIFTSYSSFKDDSESFYFELENSSYVKTLIEKYPDTEDREVALIPGYCASTPFGNQFAEVCLID